MAHGRGPGAAREGPPIRFYSLESDRGHPTVAYPLSLYADPCALTPHRVRGASPQAQASVR